MAETENRAPRDANGALRSSVPPESHRQSESSTTPPLKAESPESRPTPDVVPDETVVTGPSDASLWDASFRSGPTDPTPHN